MTHLRLASYKGRFDSIEITEMKRTKLLLTLIVIFSFLSVYIEPLCARSYKDIHHLLTDDEREMIFGHPFVEYVPEFDVSHPIQVDERGRFLSRDLANGNARRKRDLDGPKSKEPVFFKLSAFGQDLHLNVTINDELFSPNFEIEIRGNGSSEFHYEIDHCHYIGRVVPTGGTGNKVAISNCEGLHGMIRTPQGVFMVHPLPDRLKLGKNNTRAHVIHRRSLSPTHAQSLAQALEEEKRSDSWCGVEGEATVQQFDEGDDNHRNSERSFRPNKKRTIESMLVVEKEMTRFYGVSQIEKYVPTMANMAQGLLADASIGANVKYVVTKLLILQKDQPGLVISTHASSTLDSFCKWTTGQNIADDTSPRHFDHAALFSKYNFCRNKGNVQDQGCGTILGLAQLKGMCRPDVSCTLNKDTGLGTAFTLAHETAHNLGSEHDGEGNKCNDGVYIMATRASGKVTAFDWSPCSRNYVTKFLQTQQAHCLNDNEPKSKFALPKGLPGKRYDGDAQCVRMFGAGAKVCEIPDLKAKMCVNLHCEKPDGYCSSNDEPAADGTKCGNNKWCMRGRCVSDKIKPGYQDVDGNWGAWKPWSSCYPQCGQGLSTRERKCDNPAPKRGGKLCQGNAKEYKFCDNPKCPSSFENPRNKQCKDHRHVQFQGGPYNWIYDPYYAQGSPKCVLSCATTNGDTTSFGNVKDGTPCTDQPNSGVCINGKCQKPKPGSVKPKPGGGKPKPSGSRPRPSGSRPKPSDIFRGTYSKVPPADEYYVPIATIPAGARNVKIEEATASENNLLLEDADFTPVLDYDTYLADFGPKTFTADGNKFKFRKVNQKELVEAAGPLTKSFELLYENMDQFSKYTVNYEYIKPNTQSTRSLGLDNDFPELVQEIYELDEALGQEKDGPGEARWEIGIWTDCTKSCNDGEHGIKTREVFCVIDSQGVELEVDDSKCKKPKPAGEEACGNQPCPAEWYTVHVGQCSTSCGPGVQPLEVKCVKINSSGETNAVDSKECTDIKPPTHVACNVENPCDKESDSEE